MKKKVIIAFFVFILLLPVWSIVVWRVQKPKHLNVILINKSVYSIERLEHKAFSWVLNSAYLVNPNGNRYDFKKEYWGYLPISIEPEKYTFRDFEQYNSIGLKKIANETDLIYVADTYGVYRKNNLLNVQNFNFTKYIYNGLSSNEMDLLAEMKAKGKTIITEFNILGPPTADSIRNRFESTFNINWTGWAGRYFDDLDTIKNRELPKWLIKLYKNQYEGGWHFIGAGIAFVHRSGRVLILENKKHLNVEIPFVLTKNDRQKEFHLKDSVHYPFWFDITLASGDTKIIAYYNLSTTKLGEDLLLKNGIPHQFPAVLETKKKYTFYYFAGDFSNTPLNSFGSYFRGIEYFNYFLYNDNYNERTKFFWKFYRPLLSKIIENQMK